MGTGSARGAVLTLPNLPAKPTQIRRKAVHEVGVCGIMGDQFRAPLEPHEHYSTIVLSGLRGALKCVPIMPRDASLSDSYTPDRCCFSSLPLELLENYVFS